MSDTIHIVCLDAPAPPDYGGVFDLYYKIPELHRLGKKIILHYFDYKNGRNADALKPFCMEIHAYKRSSFLLSLIRNQSYIVSSRTNRQLIHRLNSDSHPILIEGIHCLGILRFLDSSRKVMLRLHNDEAAYYQQMARTEKHWMKRMYFHREQKLLQSFQSRLPVDLCTVSVSLQDLDTFTTKYGFRRIHFLPCFLPWQEISATTGKGSFCLYHGNLHVAENIEAALWLVNHVFTKTSHPLIIAGKNASSLASAIRIHPNIQLVESPDDATLDQLIRSAHIHVLPSMNVTGVKIKLLHVLFKGRHCITNTAGFAGSGLAKGVNIADDENAMAEMINSLMKSVFTEKDIALRQAMLTVYDNRKNAERLSELLKHCQ